MAPMVVYPIPDGIGYTTVGFSSVVRINWYNATDQLYDAPRVLGRLKRQRGNKKNTKKKHDGQYQ